MSLPDVPSLPQSSASSGTGLSNTGRTSSDALAVAGAAHRVRFANWRQLVASPIRVIAAIIVVSLIGAAVLAPVISPYDPLEIDIKSRLAGPSGRHLLGTDELGRDLLSNILYASRISLLVGAGATGLGGLIAIPLGLLAGLRGGIIDTAVMRLTDGLLAIPYLLLALAIVTSLGTNMSTLLLALALTLIPATIRIIRAEALVEEGKEYVVAARALGASEGRVMMRHVLPNTLSTILIQLTLGMTLAILIEAFMSYVGLGIQPPRASLGTLLSSGYGFVGLSSWYVTFPGLFIFALVWSLNVLGDSLRDALDPRLRRIDTQAGR
ncbi:MAG: peptide/nickel transport system permease protein [Thermomicrobiales bacterium]|nr:peptide/nickel transport system permease protein [Thermomicrobiales bacterium]